MKVVICLFFVAVCAVASAKPGGDHYTTKYDNVDLDAIIKNDRLLKAYVDCLAGTKKCTKDGEELKSKFNWWVEREVGFLFCLIVVHILVLVFETLMWLYFCRLTSI